MVTALRNVRGEMNIPPAKLLPVYLHNGNLEDRCRVAENATFLKVLARLESLAWLNPAESAPPSATQLIGDMEILVPMAGLIDKKAELARLAKEIERLRGDVARVETKLQNPSFVDHAPVDVVTQSRAKLNEQRAALARLEEQLEKIKVL